MKREPQPKLETKEEISDWLNMILLDVNKDKFTIHDDLTVDVHCSINMGLHPIFNGKTLDFFPVQFGVIDGDFGCNDNRTLKTLKGCPHIVNGDFYFSYCAIRDLEYFPVQITGNVICVANKPIVIFRPPWFKGLWFNHIDEIRGVFVYIELKEDGTYSDMLKEMDYTDNIMSIEDFHKLVDSKVGK